MKHAKVSELKARLSEYLAGVRAGGSVTVYDRSVPIARLVPLGDAAGDGFEVEEPSSSVTASPPMKTKPVRLRKRVDVVRILREGRGDR